MTKLFGSQLTPEQIEERRKGIGSSDAAKIIAGGEAWAELWNDKTGRSKPKRIMSEWDAALRHTTEELQLSWFEHKNPDAAVLRGENVEYHSWPVLRANLDGRRIFPLTVIECKHISEWTDDPINWCIEKYSPQVQHQMIVTGTDKSILSVIVGMKEPQWIEFTLDPFWADVYIARCQEFWGFVERDEPPPGAEPLPPPIPHEDMKIVDFSSSNEFASFAADWLENQSAAKKFTKAADGIKKLIPPDCRQGFGFGINVTRSKAGALTIKETKNG